MTTQGRSGGRRIAFGLMVAAVFAVCGAGAAQAQIGRGNEPIEVTSDKLEASRSDGRAVYVGNVEATQGNSRMMADRLIVVCAEPPPGQRKEECGEVQQLIAESNVHYITADEHIRGDRAEYDYRNDTITVTGDVIMTRGDDGVIRGPKLVYEVEKGLARMIGEKNRPVTSIFTPVDRNKPAPGSGSPAPQ